MIRAFRCRRLTEPPDPANLRVSMSPTPSRAIQLDGLRALAMLGICWDHWVPESWNFRLPYEIGLYFFLVLTGYFITGSLLRIRDRAEETAAGGKWRWEAWKDFQWRRGLRIIAPYYVALAIAFLFLAPKLWHHIHWYLLYLTNFHIALRGEWPHGTSHFWSIAIQQQFYLFWPAVIWLTPKRLLPLAMVLFAGMAPLSRYYEHLFMPPFIWPEKISWGLFDFFGIGGLMALLIHRGFSLSSRIWKILMVVCCGAYLVFEFGPRFGLPPNRIGPFYTVILSIGLCGVIATASLGWQNIAGRFLETAFLQRVGLLSYGIYLYHNLAPIILGKTLPFLWWGPYAESIPQIAFRVALCAALTWAMTLASWKYLETPLNTARAKGRGE
jgi:peptidoglycan/LPS O-acetylase OafA/YrhL